MSSRTRLDWLVFEGIWDRLKSHVHDEYGQIDGYLSRAVETAMREAIDEHRYAPVEERVRTLVDAVGAKKTDAEVSTFSPDSYTGKTRATVYVDKSLLARYKQDVDAHSQYCYGVTLSQHLSYYLQGGRPSSLVGQLDRVIQEFEREQDNSLTTAEEIADRLGDQFTRKEFLEAAEASGVGTKKYALQEYLPKVMDELGVYPHPGDADRFVPRDSPTIPETPDPRTLPYHAMTEADKQLALKVAALHASKNNRHGLAKFTVADGVDALGGCPRHSTVRPLLRDIADESAENGFEYDDDVPGIKISAGVARAADYDNEAALDILGWLDDTPVADQAEDADQDAGETDPTPGADKWVETAADALADMPPDVPDTVVENKIARARYPDEIDAVEGPTEKALARVTTAECERVKKHLGWIDSNDAGHDAGTTDEWESLAEATPVATDGGTVGPNPSD